MERETIDEVATKAGTTVKGMASEAQASAERVAKQAGATLGTATEALSKGVKQTGQYLQEGGMSGIVEDLELLIRRYPLQTLLLGVGCGYLLSRLRAE